MGLIEGEKDESIKVVLCNQELDRRPAGCTACMFQDECGAVVLSTSEERVRKFEQSYIEKGKRIESYACKCFSAVIGNNTRTIIDYKERNLKPGGNYGNNTLWEEQNSHRAC